MDLRGFEVLTLLVVLCLNLEEVKSGVVDCKVYCDKVFKDCGQVSEANQKDCREKQAKLCPCGRGVAAGGLGAGLPKPGALPSGNTDTGSSSPGLSPGYASLLVIGVIAIGLIIGGVIFFCDKDRYCRCCKNRNPGTGGTANQPAPDLSPNQPTDTNASLQIADPDQPQP